VARPRLPLPTRLTEVPPLPASYDAVLDRGLAALGLELPPGARVAIEGHARLLLAWTMAINLTAIRDPAEVARLHVVDSLSALPLLRRLGVRAFIDLGSGGGYPGLPLAAALPAERALLVDSVAKKVRFLESAATATGLDRCVVPVTARSEFLAHDPGHREAWPAVLARAVTGLTDLVELALPLLAPGGVLVAWKREPLAEELHAARGALRALHGRAEVVDPAVPGLETHRLVVVHKDGRAGGRFPRDPAERRRAPL
jgi:16S rRNA (guanine527-N7)-methyltransferase